MGQNIVIRNIKSALVWCFFTKHVKLQKEDFKLLSLAMILSLTIFSSFYANYAYGEAVSLTVAITSALTFTTTGNVTFTSMTAGAAYQISTTTLSVTTNNTAGWNITLSGNDQGPANTVMDLTTDAAVGIADQTEWTPGAATTTAGTAVVRASLDSSGDVLAFRVMTASSTNGIAFWAPSWWGASDADGTAEWAGIASSTVARQIGNAGSGSYSASAHLNDVLYYLKVSASQQTGTYDGGLTYTATGN